MKVMVAQDKGEAPPDAPMPEPPPLNHDLDYVFATWLQHKLHHTYPRAGGYDDQDEYLMQDWHTLNLYYARVNDGIFSSVWFGDQNRAGIWRNNGLMDG